MFLAIVSQIIPIIIPPLVAVSIAGGAALYQGFLQRLPKALHDQVSAIATQAVEAVEQSMQGASGEAKKAAAVQYVQSILGGLHLNVPAQLVDSVIESAVYGLNQYQLAVKPKGQPTQELPIIQPAAK